MRHITILFFAIVILVALVIAEQSEGLEEPIIAESDVTAAETYSDESGGPEAAKEPAPEDYSRRHAFVTFRKQFLKDPKGEKISLRQLWNDEYLPVLKEAQDNHE